MEFQRPTSPKNASIPTLTMLVTLVAIIATGIGIIQTGAVHTMTMTLLHPVYAALAEVDPLTLQKLSVKTRTTAI